VGYIQFATTLQQLVYPVFLHGQIMLNPVFDGKKNTSLVGESMSRTAHFLVDETILNPECWMMRDA
jgi:hypothetical protein